MAIAQWSEALQLISTCALVGVIWIVQIVIYPGFSLVDRQHWHRAHQHHCAAISWVVIPLMLTEMAAGIYLLIEPTPAVSRFQPALLGCTALVWISTAFIQVPLHNRLRVEHNSQIIRRLVVSNGLRTAAWTAKAAILCATI